jgi:hypothetical protein
MKFLSFLAISLVPVAESIVDPKSVHAVHSLLISTVSDFDGRVGQRAIGSLDFDLEHTKAQCMRYILDTSQADLDEFSSLAMNLIQNAVDQERTSPIGTKRRILQLKSQLSDSWQGIVKRNDRSLKKRSYEQVKVVEELGHAAATGIRIGQEAQLAGSLMNSAESIMHHFETTEAALSSLTASCMDWDTKYAMYNMRTLSEFASAGNAAKYADWEAAMHLGKENYNQMVLSHFMSMDIRKNHIQVAQGYAARLKEEIKKWAQKHGHPQLSLALEQLSHRLAEVTILIQGLEREVLDKQLQLEQDTIFFHAASSAAGAPLDGIRVSSDAKLQKIANEHSKEKSQDANSPQNGKWSALQKFLQSRRVRVVALVLGLTAVSLALYRLIDNMDQKLS